MSPDQLPAVMSFVRVAHHGNFTRAAAELNVTPSALSQTIRNLERRLGIRLLNRTTRRVGVTELGRQFLEQVAPALDSLGAAFGALDEQRDRPTGLLRLNVPRIAMEIVIEPCMDEFLRKYPDVRLDICLDDNLSDLVAGEFDAGVRLGESLAAEMIAVPISPEQRQVVVGSPEYFRRRSKPKEPEELHQHACIRYRFGSGRIYRWEFTRPNDKHQEFEIEVDGPLIVNDVRTTLDAALRGVGLAYVLEERARSHIQSGRLIPVLQAWSTPFPGFYLYYPNRAHLPLKLRVFIDHLRSRIGTAAKTRRNANADRKGD